MVKDKKYAFSLAEMMAAMIIVVMVGVAALPALTQKKPQTHVQTIRGQFGCWREGGKLKQWYFDERSPRTENPKNVTADGKCTLVLDNRPAHFYIVAVGADENGFPGDVVTKYTPAISSKMDIIIPTSGNVEVINSNNGLPEVVAGSGKDYLANGLRESTLDASSCKIKSGKSHCPYALNDPYSDLEDSEITQTSCEIISVSNSINETNEKAVRITGCTNFDEFGSPTDKNIIPLKCLKYEGRETDGEVDLSDLPSAKIPTLHSAPSSQFKYVVDSSVSGCSKYHFNNRAFKMNFRLKGEDATRVAPRNYLGCEDCSVSKHKFVQILDDITDARKTKLVEKLRDIYKDTNTANNKGAVLIIW